MKKHKFYLLAAIIISAAGLVYCSKQKDNLNNSESEKTASSRSTEAVGTTSTPIQIYGVWHAGNEACGWSTERNMTEFDAANHWLIDRGNGQPSVNLVVLSFVNPLKLLNKTTDAQTLNGLPRGMTQAVVNYFKTRGIRVMLSIGGITYTNDWNSALAQNATQLGLNAAEVAVNMGVGIEIDYEQSNAPNLTGLQSFITAYRSVLPYDASGNNHAARLTIDLAAGDRWLIDICRKATADWLRTDTPVLDYANAMVEARQASSAAAAQANWQEHIDGKSNYSPVIPPLAPCKFTGAVYLVTGKSAAPECNNFNNSLAKSTGTYVQSVVPNGAGTSPGMLGYMYWAAECPSSRRICTTPPNSCENGVGTGATFYNIQIPMPTLRQQ
ncbi:glycoside hydrolase family 18 protein [Solitalea canadensis]|uniref:GH18 domain-containing protein n=1 Tax=Solitalea canadensis (strain ATCC 29591 / DSM 3403 / JCM 21819 / LMG 8368 / NBRC 15130 / NCIMB 12057 / USAM 9D) TaxID=929556 RepID=H8KR12_SOLCM|nr:hypothetical protein [Solitalea canadensis]AFD07158.1 hypothetical protein Solca_2104 [Solitalea canadensis DSM 3403]